MTRDGGCHVPDAAVAAISAACSGLSCTVPLPMESAASPATSVGCRMDPANALSGLGNCHRAPRPNWHAAAARLLAVSRSESPANAVWQPMREVSQEWRLRPQARLARDVGEGLAAHRVHRIARDRVVQLDTVGEQGRCGHDREGLPGLIAPIQRLQGGHALTGMIGHRQDLAVGRADRDDRGRLGQRPDRLVGGRLHRRVDGGLYRRPCRAGPASSVPIPPFPPGSR